MRLCGAHIVSFFFSVSFSCSIPLVPSDLCRLDTHRSPYRYLAFDNLHAWLLLETGSLSVMRSPGPCVRTSANDVRVARASRHVYPTCRQLVIGFTHSPRTRISLAHERNPVSTRSSGSISRPILFPLLEQSSLHRSSRRCGHALTRLRTVREEDKKIMKRRIKAKNNRNNPSPFLPATTPNGGT